MDSEYAIKIARGFNLLVCGVSGHDPGHADCCGKVWCVRCKRLLTDPDGPDDWATLVLPPFRRRHW